MKSAKKGIRGAAKAFSDWSTAETPSSHQMDYLVERWKHFENEINSARNNRNGPLRWVAPPNRNPEDVTYQRASATRNPTPAPKLTPPSVSSSQVSSAFSSQVSSSVKESDTKMDRAIENSVEEGKAELARYLRNHQMELETQQELLKIRRDRMAVKNLPKLERHSMVNPQKLYTPTAKLKFHNVPTPKDYSVESSSYQPQPTHETIAQKESPTPVEVRLNTSNKPDAALSQPETSPDTKTKVITKLAAWSKSLEPPPPDPPKPVQPPNVLQVITAKVPQETVNNPPPPQESMSDTETEENTSPSNTEYGDNRSPQLPSLVEQLQTSSTLNEPKLPNSPYPVIPYALRHHVPTPSAVPWMVSRGKRQLAKEPMSFESPLTSIERRMDLPQIQSPPYTISLSTR